MKTKLKKKKKNLKIKTQFQYLIKITRLDKNPIVTGRCTRSTNGWLVTAKIGNYNRTA